MSRELKRWQAILLATAIVLVPILSCSQRSLVLVTVNAPEGATGYANVSLVITANGQVTTTFNQASFTDGAYKAGVYLPSDTSGPVAFSAEVVKDGCQIATGGPVSSPDVSSGETVSLSIDLVANAGPCVPVDGGAGSGGEGIGGGTGGVTTGTGGAVGSGGAAGSGGVVGNGGHAGGGHGGSAIGGAIGSGGHGGSATGGAIGSGGATGTGGVIGAGGVVGSGGGGGKGGSASGGTLGTGGLVGTGGVVGSGGSSGCTCSGPNEICQPGTTTCVCSQSDSTACASVSCGTVTNICNQTVQCPNDCPSGYVCDTTLNTCRKLVVTGCGGSVGTGLVAGTDSAPICPLD